MQRLIKAWQNSLRAFTRLARTEAAFRQELILLAAALPLGFVLSATWRGYALLIGSILLIMLVEVLNTSVEAACDAVSREFSIDIQLAKDCGSFAVLISILLAGTVWLLAIVEAVFGLSL